MYIRGGRERQYKAVLQSSLFLQGSVCLFWDHLTSDLKYSSELPSEERKEETSAYRLQSPIGQWWLPDISGWHTDEC